MDNNPPHNENSETAKLKSVFGLSYLWQGASGLLDTPMTFFIKDVLKLSDAWGQIFSGATTIGWLIKPLWGWVSDRFPIRGKHRQPWFVLMALLAASAWIAAALGAWTGRTEALYFFVVFNCASIGAAFVDVVGDALMVEHGQRLNLVSTFVNHQWTMYAIASALAGFIGGWLTGQVNAGHIGYQTVFISAAILPLIAAFVGWRMIVEVPKEKKVKVSTPAEYEATEEQPKTFREKYGLLLTLFFFIFFWNFNPSFGYINRSYLIDHRGYTPEIFGTLALISGCVFLASVVCYRIVTMRFPKIEWHHWLYMMIALGLIGLPINFFMYLEPNHPWWKAVNALLPHAVREWNLMSSWNEYVWFNAIAGSLLSFAAIPAFMIPLKIAGKGISTTGAGMQYAFLMSTANASGTVNDLLGGALYGWFFDPTMWAAIPTSLLTAFSGSVFDIADTPDKRALILELFVWVGAIFTLFATPFVMATKRAFDKRKIAVSLHESE